MNSPIRWTSTHAAPPAASAEDGGEHGEPEVGDAGQHAAGHDVKYRGTICRRDNPAPHG